MPIFHVQNLTKRCQAPDRASLCKIVARPKEHPIDLLERGPIIAVAGGYV